jgi:hypothetical protein
MTISAETLAAYVDGELDETESARVEAALEQDPTLADALARHMMLSTRLSAAFDPVLAEPLPDRLVAAVHGGAPDLSPAGARRQTGRDNRGPALATRDRARAPSWRGWAAMAACLVVGISAGLFTPHGQPIVLNADMTARGALASALNTNLTADPQQAIHIGLTFRRAGGEVCRTFDMAGKGLAGVACRAGPGWKVQVAVPSQTQAASDYRTASSLPGPVAAAVDAMIDGQPFDATAEKAARDHGWK